MPFMGRVPAQQPSQAVSALKSPSQFDDSTYELSGTESQMQGRREAIAQAVAALGVAAAVTQNQPALAEDGLSESVTISGRLGAPLQPRGAVSEGFGMFFKWFSIYFQKKNIRNCLGTSEKPMSKTYPKPPKHMLEK